MSTEIHEVFQDALAAVLFFTEVYKKPTFSHSCFCIWFPLAKCNFCVAVISLFVSRRVLSCILPGLVTGKDFSFVFTKHDLVKIVFSVVFFVLLLRGCVLSVCCSVVLSVVRSGSFSC